MINKLNIQIIIPILLGIIIFLASFSASPFNDPDFGWHLKTGDIIVKERQLPSSDLFSYTMPDYRWVDYEYFFHIFIWLIYSVSGVYGIAAAFALLNIFLFLYLLPKTSLPESPAALKTLLGFLAFVILAPLVGARPVVLTWIGFTLILIILRKVRLNPSKEKFFWFIPAVFLVWANSHPGFFIGFVLAVFFLAIEYRKASSPHYFSNGLLAQANEVMPKKTIKKAVLILAISAAATLINPYFFNIHLAVFNVLSDSLAKTYIMEWMPLNVGNFLGASYLLFALFFFLLAALSGPKKGELTDFMLAVFFFVFGFMSFRNAPFFIFISFPEIFRRLNKIRVAEIFSNPRVPKLTAPLFLILIIFFLPFYKKYVWQSFESQEREKYPIEAIEYLKREKIEGNIFNFYDWGGYLIWNLPEKKLFIDGRMTEWKIKDRHILRDYKTISNLEKGWEQKMGQYGINYILLPPDYPLVSALYLSDNWEEAHKSDMSVILKKKL